MTLPVIRSAWKRTFPLRAVTIIFIGQFDVFVSPQFVTAPCHRFFPVSSTLGIARAAHHLPGSSTNTSHCQSLHALLIVFLELLGNNDACTFHVVNPSLILSPAQTQDTTKLDPVPKWAEPGTLTVCRPIHQLHEAQPACTSSRRHQYASSLAVSDHRTEPSSRKTWSLLWRSCATCWLLNIPDCPATFPVPPCLPPHAKSNVCHCC